MNIQQELRKLSDPKRAEGEKKYLKSALKHYGVTVPHLHKLAKEWIKENKELTIDEVIKTTNHLWASNWHEEKALATHILTERRHDLEIRHLPTIEHMVTTAIGWALIDDIAAWLVGTLYELDPNKMTPVLKQWIKSDNFWVRRTATLAQLIPLREGRGNLDLFTELAVPLLSEKEFFIRKAIGWVLRDTSKKRPELVFDFVQKYGHLMSGLTYREATRRLPESMQLKLKESK